MTKGPNKTPGVGLVTLLVAIAIGWAAATRAMRPVVRDAGDTPPAVAGEIRDRLPDMRIDLNQATAAELMLLPGIGPRLAEGIVDDRAAHGPYRCLDDLRRVRWVGPVLVERIALYAVVEVQAETAEPRAPDKEAVGAGRAVGSGSE